MILSLSHFHGDNLDFFPHFQEEKKKKKVAILFERSSADFHFEKERKIFIAVYVMKDF